MFWGDPWIDDDTSFRINSDPVASFEDMVVNDFFIPGTRDWDVEILQEIFSEEECRRILSTAPGPIGSIDKLVWHFEKNGRYSVKSAYKLAYALVHESVNNTDREWDLIWKFKVPPRLKAFFWRLCRGFLAVKDKLNRWYPGMGALCSICKEAGMTETIWHLFIDCSFAKACWVGAGLWNAINELCIQTDGATDFFRKAVSLFSPGDCEKLMGITWALWRCRNLAVWHDQSMSVSDVSFLAACSLMEWKNVRLPMIENRLEQRCKHWHRPRAGFVKLNVDASFYADTLQTGAGFVFRRSDGTFFLARSILRDGLMRVDVGEAWGLTEALKCALELGYENVEVETDAQMVRDAYNSDELPMSIFEDYIGIGKSLMSSNRGYSLNWVSRNANTLAHAFARAARDFGSSHSWDEPPEFVDGRLDWCTLCM